MMIAPHRLFLRKDIRVFGVLPTPEKISPQENKDGNYESISN
jgi:hypothetical protein